MGLWSWLFERPPQYTAEMAEATEAEAASSAAGEDQQILKLRVGDVVGHEGIDYLIEQKYIYSSGGYYWYTYHLAEKALGKELWISAEYDDELIVTLDQSIQLDIPAQVTPSLRFQERTYKRSEHGHAQVTLWNAGSSKPVNTKVEYWDFEGPDDETSLAVERWDDETEIFLCRSIEPYQLTIFQRQAAAEGG